MRIPYTPEMVEMEKKIKPYLVRDGLRITLSPEAPDEIVEMDKRLDSMIDNLITQMTV